MSTDLPTIQIAEPVVGDEEWQATRAVFESGWLTQGARVQQFEAAFAELTGAAHALAVTSCTTGLHLALAAAGVGPGDEVIVPAFTWVATANTVRQLGAHPVFVDVDLDTYNIDPTGLAEVVGPATRAVVPVHLFGLCADVPAVRAAVGDDVFVLEDAACAVGGSHDGVPAGVQGDAASFSFHPRKIITTGEGGMLTTNDDALAERAEMLRNHGASVPEEVRHHGPKPHLLPDFDLVGFNYRMTDLQAAVGCVQLERLSGLLARRRELAARFTERLSAVSWIIPPVVPDGYEHGWQSYVSRVPEGRDAIMDRLLEVGISTRPGTHAPALLGAYTCDPSAAADVYPRAAELQATTLALPLHNKMSDDDVDRVLSAVESI